MLIIPRQLVCSWNVFGPVKYVMLHFIYLLVFPFVRWNDKVHGKTSEAFYIWIEDPESNYMYHSELFLMTRKQVRVLTVVHYVIKLTLKSGGKN